MSRATALLSWEAHGGDSARRAHGGACDRAYLELCTPNSPSVAMPRDVVASPGRLICQDEPTFGCGRNDGGESAAGLAFGWARPRPVLRARGVRRATHA